MKNRTVGLLLMVGLVVVMLGALAGSASAVTQTAPTFEPYQIPPQVPPPSSPWVWALLRGSSVTAEGPWIAVHLSGGPYQVGFQNGYLTAQSADYMILQNQGAPGNEWRAICATVAQDYVWPLVPREYKQEMRGIADGLHAAGYPQDTLWDVVAANGWCDFGCYASLLPDSATASSTPATAAALAQEQAGCSAFIATGSATADGRPVMGHDTWVPYCFGFMMNVMYYVDPSRGYDFSYQAAGGQIWSGLDWYENSGGLLLTETTLADTFYTPTGLPVFVRAREAAQYDDTVAEAVRTLMTRNNGAYSNEWLIGDRTGRIASLQLGGNVYDLNVTRNGFFGSCNFDWGPNTRAEQADAGVGPQDYDPSEVCYARYIRWGQLRDKYYGRVDARIGRKMESDTFDSYLGREMPDGRSLCGEPDHFTPDLPDYEADSYLWICGALDGKVCTEEMALHGLRCWACWGRGSGDHFDAAAFLAANPDWASIWGDWADLAVFGLQTFSADTTDRWMPLGAHD